MDNAWDKLTQQLREMGVNMALARQGITVRDDVVQVIFEHFQKNPDQLHLLEQSAYYPIDSILLNLMTLSPQQAQSILTAIKNDPANFGVIVSSITGQPGVFEEIAKNLSLA